MPTIRSLKFTRESPKICPKFTQNSPGIHSQFAQESPEINPQLTLKMYSNKWPIQWLLIPFNGFHIAPFSEDQFDPIKSKTFSRFSPFPQEIIFRIFLRRSAHNVYQSRHDY